MASSKALASTALLLILNLLFFSLLSANAVPCPPTVKPTPKPSPKPKPKPHHATCPCDTVKLGVCADMLGGLISLNVGKPSRTSCCSLLEGMADLEAAVCLCTDIKDDILGINLNVPVSLSMVLNYCGKKVPAGSKCA